MLNKIIYWAPRALGLLFVVFLSLFAGDVFNEYQGFAVLMALFIHLLPALVLLLIVVLAWKYELVGAICFLLAAIGYVWMVGIGRHWSWYVFVSGLMLLVSILFFLSWWQKKRVKKIVSSD